MRLTGRQLSQLQSEHHGPPLPWRLLKLVVAPTDRSLLHARIEQRFAAMLEEGFLDEVAALRDRGDLDLDRPAMRAVGYRQAWQHLEGDFDREEMIRRAQAATRQLAKRQLTWLRREGGATWFDSLRPDVADVALDHVRARLQGDGTVAAGGSHTMLD